MNGLSNVEAHFEDRNKIRAGYMAKTCRTFLEKILQPSHGYADILQNRELYIIFNFQ